MPHSLMETPKDPIRVVHFSVTPLAGAPIRLVQTLNRLTKVEARLIDLTRFGIYDHDVVFDETPQEALRLAKQADILHLHNYIDLDCQQFAPIDFKKLFADNKRIIRHFHSTSDWIAEQMGSSEEELLACSLPSLVIAQYPERFFRKSLVIPNLIPHSHPLYTPLGEQEPEFDIFFSHTKTAGAFERRWDTKAAPEMIRIIEQVATQTGCSYKIITGKPLSEVLQVKQKARIVIDDLATGSYHLTGLEGLTQGKPVLSFLDERCLHLLRHFSGLDHCPFINVRLEDARQVLIYLLDHPDVCRKIGRASRNWILSYWNEEKLIQFYVQAYEKLLEDPDAIKRQEKFNIADNDFFNWVLPDLIFKARKHHYQRQDFRDDERIPLD
ncbi:hypothetical protein [uncultured Desulfobacter sp.]|uniref:glycosyltransferase n=1 Tax=uncultured Desulfobacter sp. TaxID=240139 RepID=UPI0029F57BE2|nr:hypothetical protein [uncultured Desulfobacter sp.]